MQGESRHSERSPLFEGLFAGCGLALLDGLASGPWRTPIALTAASLGFFALAGLCAGGVARALRRNGLALGLIVSLGVVLNGLSLGSKDLSLSKPALLGVAVALCATALAILRFATILGQRSHGLYSFGLLAMALVPGGTLLWNVLAPDLPSLIVISLLPVSVLWIATLRERKGHGIGLLAALACAALALPVALEGGPRAREAPSAPRGPGAAADAPNVLLIVIDTLRADRVTAEGAGAFGALAREGVFFEQAVSAAPWTLPAMGSLMTGLYPSQHGAVSARNPLPAEVTTLAERLLEAGYSTSAFTGGAFVAATHRLDQGFEHFDPDVERAFPAFRTHVPLLWRLAKNRYLPLFPLVRLVEEYRGLGGALKALRAWSPAPDRPFFLFVHTYQVHDYYLFDPRTDDAVRRRRDPPPRFAGRFSVHPDELRHASPDELDWFREIYDERLADVERTLGELLAYVGGLCGERDMIVVLTSDHGEGFDAAHARVHHGGRLHDDLLRVPWILRAPGLPAGLRVPDQVRTLDLTPTLLDLLGLEPLEGIAGRSLLQALEGRASFPATAFAETSGHGAELLALRQQHWKWILKPGPDEVYDLSVDALEVRPLERGPVELEALLNGFRESYPPRPREETIFDAVTEKHLRDLGYTGGEDSP